MRIIFFSSLIIVLFTTDIPGQDVHWGLGFELNQTRFRQNAPTITTEFSNPHQADFGAGAYTFATLNLSEKWAIKLQPGLSIMRTKSDVTSSTKASYFNVSVQSGYYLHKKVILSAGVSYSYLVGLISTFQRQSADLTFFANHRHYINPTLTVSYNINSNWNIHFSSVFFLRDLFNSGALDRKGNIVGPIMVYPYSIALGVNYGFQITNKRR